LILREELKVLLDDAGILAITAANSSIAVSQIVQQPKSNKSNGFPPAIPNTHRRMEA
jgi:hypothetical protein